MKRPRIPALSGFRALAALHLLAYHALGLGLLPDVARGGAVESLLAAGYTTTSLFLVLSGFVLYYAFVTDEGHCWVDAPVLLRNRLAALYPVAVLGHLLALPIALAGAMPMPELLRRGFAVLTLTQAWFPAYAFSFDGPTWTLSCLFAFYAAFPFVAARVARLSTRAALVALVGTWLVAQALAIAYLAVHPQALAERVTRAGDMWAMVLHTFPVVRMWEFLSGVVLARVLLDRSLPSAVRGALTGVPTGLALGALVALLAWASPSLPYGMLHNGLLLPVHWVLVGSFIGARGLVGRVLTSPPLVRLGESSMPVYLLHMPLLVLFAAAVRRGWVPATTLATTAAGVAIVALSVVVFERVANPIARAWRVKVAPPSAPPAQPVAAPESEPLLPRLPVFAHATTAVRDEAA